MTTIAHPVNPAPTDSQTWNTTELQSDFIIKGFAAGFVVVIRKADNVRGTLQFNGQPRVYHTFQEA